MPAEMSFDAAAAYGITYATAIYAFEQCGRLRPGETVLVLGAAGGVGLASIEVVKAMARWSAEGKINPVIDSTVSLDQIPAAMKRLTDRKVKGKVIVKVRAE